jgi:hypothetical protein
VWSYVYEQALATGMTSHEATVTTQTLMHKLAKAAPTTPGGPPYNQAEWLRRTWDKAE